MYNRRSPKKFKTIRYVSPSQFRKLEPDASILYIKKWYCDVHADWKDEEFIKKLRKLISPRVALTGIVFPERLCDGSSTCTERWGLSDGY